MPGTVTVASKLPHKLLLRVFDMVEGRELVMGGGVNLIKKAVEKQGARMEISGVAAPFGHAPQYPIIGGYALTPNIDADHFEQWLAQNADSDMVRNKLIWAHAKHDTVVSFARDNEKRHSGLEPMVPTTDTDPVGDPRMPRAVAPAERG